MLLAALGAAVDAAADPGDPDAGRVVVLGFGGADARLVEQWMAEGRLPHLAKLASGGGYARLTPTLPAQDEASWATFATGRSPGDTDLFDVVTRDPATYAIRPVAVDHSWRPFLWGDRNGVVVLGLGAVCGWLLGFVLVRLVRRRGGWFAALVPALLLGACGWWIGGRWLPEEVSEPGNRLRGKPFWEVAGEAGISASVVRLPACYPPAPSPEGRTLAGLGVPDARGTLGTPTLYTAAARPLPGADLFPVEVVAVDPVARRIETVVPGPPDPLGRGGRRVDAPLVLDVAPGGESVTLELEDGGATLAPGDWSPWLRVSFTASPVFNVHGLARFHLVSADPLTLYLEPVQLDPAFRTPATPLSAPRDWAAELSAAVGPFKTAGWAVDTWGVAAGAVGEATFMEDLAATGAAYRRILAHLLAGGARLVVQYFELPDRAGHILGEPPDASAAADPGAGEVSVHDLLEVYQSMDEVVGQVLDRLGPRDVLVVLSDHGMVPFRRAFDLNAWLREEGYLAAGPPPVPTPWAGVDWSHTRAYAVGLAGLYVNLRGRESQGVVAAGEAYEGLRRELKARLEAVVDPVTGERPVARVLTREEAWGRFDAALAPDLVVTTAPGYRLAWGQLDGHVHGPVLSDNELPWRADHASADPATVAGVLLANRPLDQQRVSMVDVAPTILGLLGLTPPEPGAGVAFMARTGSP